jgi:hypothetical protein
MVDKGQGVMWCLSVAVWAVLIVIAASWQFVHICTHICRAGSHSPAFRITPSQLDFPTDTMSGLGIDQINSLTTLAERHPKPTNIRFQYGTAGFRTLYDLIFNRILRISD